MNAKIKIAAAVLTSVVASSGLAPLQAAEVMKVMKPISGEHAAREGRDALLNLTVGRKQAVSYFLNDDGHCKLSLMVGDAFNGQDIPDPTTVRFEVAIDPSNTARFDTAEGKVLEFTCHAGAREMSVKAWDEVAIFTPGS